MKKFSPKLHPVSFGAYTREEILKLSVLEVKTPLDFDDSDQPVQGGIYDPRLGPITQDINCKSCFGNYNTCAGHLGHFMLPVPVFNPLFIKTLHQLLLGSCLQCHSLMAPLPLSLLLRAQLVALDSGSVNLVKEMDDLVHEILSSSTKNVPREVKEKLDLMLSNAGRNRVKEFRRTSGFPTDYRKPVDIDSDDSGFKSPMKNFAVYRQELVKRFTSDHLLRKTERCPHCFAPKPTIYNFGNVRFVYSSPPTNIIRPVVLEVEKSPHASAAEEPKEQPVGTPTSTNTAVTSDKEQEEKPTKSEMIILTPDVAQKHLTELWEKEKRILQQLYRILTSHAALSLPCPTDVFFLDVIAIPPPKFRPFCDTNHGLTEHPQSTALKKIMQTSLMIKNIMSVIKSQAEAKAQVPQLAEVMGDITGESPTEKLQTAWVSLQAQINCLTGDDKDLSKRNNPEGILSQTVLEPKDENFIETYHSGKSVSSRGNPSSKRMDLSDRRGVVSKLVQYATRNVTPWKEIQNHDSKSLCRESLDLSKRTTSTESVKSKSKVTFIPSPEETAITTSTESSGKKSSKNTHESSDKDVELRLSLSKPQPCHSGVKLPVDHKFVQQLRNELKAEKEKSYRLEEKLRLEKERNSRLHLSLQKEMERVKKIRDIMRRESNDDYMILRGYSDTGSDDSIC